MEPKSGERTDQRTTTHGYQINEFIFLVKTDNEFIDHCSINCRIFCKDPYIIRDRAPDHSVGSFQILTDFLTDKRQLHPDPKNIHDQQISSVHMVLICTFFE